jgi:hypothetical protein
MIGYSYRSSGSNIPTQTVKRFQLSNIPKYIISLLNIIANHQLHAQDVFLEKHQKKNSNHHTVNELKCV